MIGFNPLLDKTILGKLSNKTLVVSRFKQPNSNISFKSIHGSLPFKCVNYNKIIDLILNAKIVLQRLQFHREIRRIIALDPRIEKLIELTNKLSNVYTDQVIEIQDLFSNNDISKKINELSISTSDDISEVKFGLLKNVHTCQLNFYHYPIDKKIIFNIFNFALKSSSLKMLKIIITIENNMQFDDEVYEYLNKLTMKDVETIVKVNNNCLTFPQLEFKWLNERLKYYSSHITKLSVNLNTDHIINFTPLKHYYNLQNLDISLYYSIHKEGMFDVSLPNLKVLKLHYFDKHMLYSLKGMSHLTFLELDSCDINTPLFDGLSETINSLILINCRTNSSSKFKLPPYLNYLELHSIKLNQDFFSNLNDIKSLAEFKLISNKEVPVLLINNLPLSLKKLHLNHMGDNFNCDEFELPVNLKEIKLAGISKKFNLNVIPKSVKTAKLNIQTNLFLNQLPPLLQVLDFETRSTNNTVVEQLKKITEGCQIINHITLRSNQPSIDFTNYAFPNIKSFRFINNQFINGTVNTEICIIKIGNLPKQLVRFEIVTNTNQTILQAPDNCENRLNQLGALESVTSLKPLSKMDVAIKNVGKKFKFNGKKPKLKTGLSMFL